MIVDDGVIQLLDAQITYISGLYWGLFTTNLTIAHNTVLSTVTAVEASWTGYARAQVTSWPTPTIVAGVASMQGNTLLTFTNSSGSGVTFYGWFCLDNSASKLISALNIGSTTIPAGGTYSFAPTWTDGNTGP